MKIAFIIGRWPSNSHTAVLNQVVEINKQGHEAKTFLSFNIDELNSKNLLSEILEYKLNKNVFYIKQPILSKFSCKILNKIYVFVLALPYLFRTFFYSPKIFFKALFKKQYGEYRKSFKIIFAIQNLLKQNLKFDVIHCQYAPWGNWGAIFKDLGLIQGKLVTSFRGYGINDIPKQKPADFYDFLIKSCDIYTSNTLFTKNNAVKIGFPEKKIHVIHTAVPIEKYKFKKRIYLNGQTFRILTAASLLEVKGLEYSIKAIKILLDKKSNIKIEYKIAGEGPLRNKLLELIKENNLQNFVKLLGYVKHDELIKLYEETHLFILPSVTTKNGNQEGQGLVLQEAQLCGISVIGTKTGGIPEGLLDNISGFLVEEKNPKAIAEKIMYFIENPDDIVEFGIRGREFCKKNFNIKIETEKLLNLYN